MQGLVVVPQYLILRDEIHARHAKTVFGDRRICITRDQARNGSRNLLDDADVLIWGDNSAQDCKRDMALAMELAPDCKRLRMIDMSEPTAEMFTPPEAAKHGISYEALSIWATQVGAIKDIPKPPAQETELEPINAGSPGRPESESSPAPMDIPALGEPAPPLDPLPDDFYGLDVSRETIEPTFEELPHSYGIEDDWGIEPLDLFKTGYTREIDLDTVPTVISRSASDAASRIGCGTGECVLGYLTTYSGAADHRFGVAPRSEDPTYVEGPRIWGAVVGPAGGKKSPAIRVPHIPLDSINDGLLKKLGEIDSLNSLQALEYENERRSWASGKDKSNRGDPPQPKERKDKPRIIVEDLTLQAAGPIARDNPRGVHVRSDELSAWIGSFDQFTKGEADRGHWLSSYDGGGRTIDRVVAGHMYIPNWSVSLAGTITPSAIRKFSGKLNEDGLLQRMMIVISTRSEIGENRKPDAKAWLNHCTIVQNLYALEFYNERQVKLSQGAQDVFDAFLKDLYILKASSIFSGAIQSHLSKWEGLAPRLMMLYQLIQAAQHPNRLPDPEIPQEFAEQVTRLLMDWLLGHILEFWFNVLDRNPQTAHIQWVAGYILAHNLQEITQRELQRDYRLWDNLSQFAKEQVFTTLTDAGWVRSGTPNKAKSGLPRRHQVNPAVHQFKAKAEKEKQDRKRVVGIMQNLGE